MIDWLTFHVQCTHKPIKAGLVQSITPEGEIEWLSEKHLTVEGSYRSSVRVKTVNELHGQGLALRIDGNPLKFLQGHNLFGSDDLVGLASAMVKKLAAMGLITPSSSELEAISAGHFELMRVDVTAMWSLPRREDVRSWLYALEHQARSRMGRAIVTGGTVYFGKNSRRWSMKFYGKGEEIGCKKKGHGLHEELHLRDELEAFADCALRGELTLRALQLKDNLLHAGSSWLNIEPSRVLLPAFIERLNMSDQFSLTSSEVADLPPRLTAVYKLWKNGEDLRALYPDRTFYRYRSALLAHGIDISIRQPHQPDNVIPLVRVITAVPVGVPDWAIGTSLYFEPRKRFA